MHHDVEVDAAEGGGRWRPRAARMGCTGRGGEGQLAETKPNQTLPTVASVEKQDESIGPHTKELCRHSCELQRQAQMPDQA